MVFSVKSYGERSSDRSRQAYTFYLFFSLAKNILEDISYEQPKMSLQFEVDQSSIIAMSPFNKKDPIAHAYFN